MTSEVIFVVQVFLLGSGCLFFAIGTLGLFRFPTTLIRTHALAKVDNLGLGLLPWVPSVGSGLKMLLIWVVALAANATSAHLVARAVVSRSRHCGGQREDES